MSIYGNIVYFLNILIKVLSKAFYNKLLKEFFIYSNRYLPFFTSNRYLKFQQITISKFKNILITITIRSQKKLFFKLKIQGSFILRSGSSENDYTVFFFKTRLTKTCFSRQIFILKNVSIFFHVFKFYT